MRDYADWIQDAACRGKSLVWFFPDRKHKSATGGKEFCEFCPVKKDCLTHAIIYDEVGVWGETTYKERRKFLPIRQQLIDAAKRSKTYHANMKPRV